MVIPGAGSIDSLAPARLTPPGLRLCRTAPAGSAPAPASAHFRLSTVDFRLQQRTEHYITNPFRDLVPADSILRRRLPLLN
jgi:hypothetical protein